MATIIHKALVGSNCELGGIHDAMVRSHLQVAVDANQFILDQGQLQDLFVLQRTPARVSQLPARRS
jgi:hypothetical protein